MPQVDFYVLPSADDQARVDFACKLVEKAWRLGHRVYVNCTDAAQSQALDDRLWRFKGEAFIPHALADCDADAPILLGHGEPPKAHEDLLVNLTDQVPAAHPRFNRVAEIVTEAPAARQAARERFRFYREQGYALQDHRLTRF
ncbi:MULTISPECIES: DNA polymerase III subunit chi [unclassified Pseudomonas]|uniref:DNA polymerase III subunit chi n=1 Tax=unclassified Pseudomonas TaxID=196821 RepID=UPI000BCDAEB6|nr:MULTISPECIES: DNA polymerase III subunit chi [unclassified Pseudomonas]PVZ11249.1 DNA polymerase III chi subunit [Pseudomonas sp. URIL14HWK12:I12]PVZ22247.1 DNA polymerase III chi subunit [Pseudomonas sp. URIL14HWK12:I10]PVZ31629.1 DNA polymerase III chi subunit [Pseudomonas sp. URIL14HWK12:I11]SNZ16655.1 DNA polymerase III, chi subunit [Pseudomonas sp. URIL14HWK12:I9]